MSKRDDLEMDELLAGGRLSGRQYDEIEQRIMARVAPRRSVRVWPALGGIAALASALGAWFLVARAPSLEQPPGERNAPSAPGDFSGKGDGPTAVAGKPAASAAALFDARCGTPSGACRMGDTLMFSVQGSVRGGYVAAYAERVGPGPAERIWYFPNSAGAAPLVPASAETTVLPQGVRLTAPHVPGRYHVTVWLAEAAPERTVAAPPPPAHAAVIVVDIAD